MGTGNKLTKQKKLRRTEQHIVGSGISQGNNNDRDIRGTATETVTTGTNNVLHLRLRDIAKFISGNRRQKHKQLHIRNEKEKWKKRIQRHEIRLRRIRKRRGRERRYHRDK